MKIIDKYIIKKFLGTFFYAMILLVAISIVVDISEKMDDFIDNAAPLSLIISDYYLNFIPYISALLSPLFIFIAVIFFTSRMAYRSEVIAIINSGVSFYRLMMPYLFSATILTIIAIFASHYWVPKANKTLIAFENTYIKNAFVNTSRHIHLQTDPNTYIYMQNYNTQDSVGYKFAYEVIVDKKLIKKLRADRIQWNNNKKMWRITNYYERTNYDMHEVIRTGVALDTILPIVPADFERRMNLKETMTTPELTAFIEKEKAKGTGNLVFYEIEKNKRTAIPFSTYILTVIGFSIASRKVRGGMGLHIAAGITISAAYILFMQISSTISTNLNMSAMLGVWLPNVVFGLLAIFLMLTAQK